MKKGIVIMTVAVILATSVFIFLEFTSSYSTAEEALINIKEVEEVVETIMFDETNTSYIIFYPADDDIILVARFDKNKFGWKYADMIGLGPVNAFINGDYVGSENFYMGGILSNVSKVKLGTKEAKMIPLEGTSNQVWIHHNTTPKYFKNNDLIFFDMEGNKL